LAGTGVAVIVTDLAAEPPGPSHVNVSVTVAEMTTDAVSLVFSLPLQAVLPLAVQAVAF
jgi:hypothetical protein